MIIVSNSPRLQRELNDCMAALIISYSSINTGIAVGTDGLLDKYSKNWIYQNKPWIGILAGINLN